MAALTRSFNNLVQLDQLPRVGQPPVSARTGSSSSDDSDAEPVQVLGTEQSVNNALAHTTSFHSVFDRRDLHSAMARSVGTSHGSGLRLASARRLGQTQTLSFAHGQGGTGGPMGAMLPGVGQGTAPDPESRDVWLLVAWLEGKLQAVNWDDTRRRLGTFIQRSPTQNHDGERGSVQGGSPPRVPTEDTIAPLNVPLMLARRAGRTSGTGASPASNLGRKRSTRGPLGSDHALTAGTPSSLAGGGRGLGAGTPMSVAGSIASLPVGEGGAELSPAVLANSVEARLERSRATAPTIPNVIEVVDYVMAVYHACMDEVRAGSTACVCACGVHACHTLATPVGDVTRSVRWFAATMCVAALPR